MVCCQMLHVDLFLGRKEREKAISFNVQVWGKNLGVEKTGVLPTNRAIELTQL